jgi:hypothetical protein
VGRLFQSHKSLGQLVGHKIFLLGPIFTKMSSSTTAAAAATSNRESIWGHVAVGLTGMVLGFGAAVMYFAFRYVLSSHVNRPRF